jgi:exosortase/archaeosortase family protein
VVHLDAAAPLLPPLLGLALVLLAEPPRQLKRWLAPLAVLSLMPFPWLLSRLLPEGPFIQLTARLTQVNLLLVGLDSAVSGPELMLDGGGVRIAGGCTGLPLIAQMTAIAVVFALAYPLPSRRWQGAMTLGAPLLGLQVNSLRIAVLAMISASSWPNKSWWFDFFHMDNGSLVFAALSVGIFAWLYIALLEQQLRARAAPRR